MSIEIEQLADKIQMYTFKNFKMSNLINILPSSLSDEVKALSSDELYSLMDILHNRHAVSKNGNKVANGYSRIPVKFYKVNDSTKMIFNLIEKQNKENKKFRVETANVIIADEKENRSYFINKVIGKNSVLNLVRDNGAKMTLNTFLSAGCVHAAPSIDLTSQIRCKIVNISLKNTDKESDIIKIYNNVFNTDPTFTISNGKTLQIVTMFRDFVNYQTKSGERLNYKLDESFMRFVSAVNHDKTDAALQDDCSFIMLPNELNMIKIYNTELIPLHNYIEEALGACPSQEDIEKRYERLGIHKMAMKHCGIRYMLDGRCEDILKYTQLINDGIVKPDKETVKYAEFLYAWFKVQTNPDEYSFYGAADEINENIINPNIALSEFAVKKYFSVRNTKYQKISNARIQKKLGLDNDTCVKFGLKFLLTTGKKSKNKKMTRAQIIMTIADPSFIKNANTVKKLYNVSISTAYNYINEATNIQNKTATASTINATHIINTSSSSNDEYIIDTVLKRATEKSDIIANIHKKITDEEQAEIDTENDIFSFVIPDRHKYDKYKINRHSAAMTKDKLEALLASVSEI